MDKKTQEVLRKIGEAMPGSMVKKTNTEKGRAQADAFLDARVKQAIKKGEIPKPTQDSWMKKQQQRMK